MYFMHVMHVLHVMNNLHVNVKRYVCPLFCPTFVCVCVCVVTQTNFCLCVCRHTVSEANSL